MDEIQVGEGKPARATQITEENIAAVTHPGLGRSSNEDNFAVAVKGAYTLVLVADGIGGHEYGDVASRLCATELSRQWCDMVDNDPEPSPDAIRNFFVTQLPAVNALIFQKNQQRRLIHPMGTTLVCAVFTPDALYYAYLGDSRLYRMRNGSIVQLTHDHSYIADLVSNHVLTEESAVGHPYAHVINHSLGVVERIEPEINVILRQPHERYLLCSDGAYLHADADDLEALLYDADTPQDACDRILRVALEGGGEDNITAIVIFA